MNASTEFRRARQIQAKKTGQNLNIFPPKSYFHAKIVFSHQK
jgi:hypothetical protein